MAGATLIVGKGVCHAIGQCDYLRHVPCRGRDLVAKIGGTKLAQIGFNCHGLRGRHNVLQCSTRIVVDILGDRPPKGIASSRDYLVSVAVLISAKGTVFTYNTLDSPRARIDVHDPTTTVVSVNSCRIYPFAIAGIGWSNMIRFEMVMRSRRAM